MPFHWGWLILVLLLALIVFGPGRLTEIGGALGRGLREFRKAASELQEEVSRTTASVTGAATGSPVQPASPGPEAGPPAPTSGTTPGPA